MNIKNFVVSVLLVLMAFSIQANAGMFVTVPVSGISVAEDGTDVGYNSTYIRIEIPLADATALYNGITCTTTPELEIILAHDAGGASGGGISNIDTVKLMWGQINSAYAIGKKIKVYIEKDAGWGMCQIQSVKMTDEDVE